MGEELREGGRQGSKSETGEGREGQSSSPRRSPRVVGRSQPHLALKDRTRVDRLTRRETYPEFRSKPRRRVVVGQSAVVRRRMGTKQSAHQTAHSRNRSLHAPLQEERLRGGEDRTHADLRHVMTRICVLIAPSSRDHRAGTGLLGRARVGKRNAGEVVTHKRSRLSSLLQTLKETCVRDQKVLGMSGAV